MTQGDSIAIVFYGIGILPLIKNLKDYFSSVTKPWYTDNAGALGMFARVREYFNSLKRLSSGKI